MNHNECVLRFARAHLANDDSCGHTIVYFRTCIARKRRDTINRFGDVFEQLCTQVSGGGGGWTTNWTTTTTTNGYGDDDVGGGDGKTAVNTHRRVHTSRMLTK